MKRKIIIISIIILAIVILIVLGVLNKMNNTMTTVESFNMGVTINKEIDDNKTILKSYSEYKEYFQSNEIKESDFNNNNFAIIKVKYDPCTDRNITLTNYQVKDNDINVTFTYDRTCGVCPVEINYYLIKVDKSISNPNINVDYKVNKEEQCDPTISKKPMIYIYPNEDKEVSIKLGKPELLTTTYPKYNSEWKVFAKTNGDLIINNKTYYGLYWEGLNNIDNNFKDGYIVYKDDLIPFLEDKLNVLGLNEREANEFIVYWLPILEQNEYNLIRFEDIDIINEQMPLDINPIPNTIIRVLMEYKEIDKDYKIKEQVLNKVERKGYTVVEWGGTNIKS